MNSTFGPIPSRRFGFSLGIDLSPNIKQCNFDCLYCELDPAKTISAQTNPTSVSDIIKEVKIALNKHSNINVITLTANGEPTLYPYLNELIDELNIIKKDKKILILSNAGNIYDKDIQNTLLKLDIVKLSLDCVSKECFKKLDRINDSVDSSKIVDGLIEFRKKFQKDFIIEILFVKDLNDSEGEIELLYQALNQIKPNRIDIGTIDRPPAYDVKPVDFDTLEKIAKSFQNLPINIIYKNRQKAIQTFDEEEIINLLKRRPLTQDDIDNTFDESSQNILNKLVKNSIISLITVSGVQFYRSKF